ncbi:hypothetical protein F0562_001636 [Nyssa sinensis]|uniref:Uncharacterized protein n=1 Tax=Nyssa sinensis TaxID=561372 RepID=A0A5J5C4Q9_9ASTE|nr:hypothetical protein F0562_001636 [Nyssa sinensis]
MLNISGELFFKLNFLLFDVADPLFPILFISVAVGYVSDGDEDDDESVASVPDELVEQSYNEELFGLKSNKNLNQSAVLGSEGRFELTLNRGLSKQSLRIEVPENVTRFTDGGLGFGGNVQRNGISGGSCLLREKVQLNNANGTPIRNNMLNDSMDLGTPSAPPIMDIGGEGSKSEVKSVVGKDSGRWTEIEQTGNAVRMSKESTEGFYGSKEVFSGCRVQSPKSELGERENKTIPGETETPAPWQQANLLDQSPHYTTSGQNAWQMLIAYDACIRLCLNAWERGCTEAPEFLRVWYSEVHLDCTNFCCNLVVRKDSSGRRSQSQRADAANSLVF